MAVLAPEAGRVDPAPLNPPAFNPHLEVWLPPGFVVPLFSTLTISMTTSPALLLVVTLGAVLLPAAVFENENAVDVLEPVTVIEQPTVNELVDAKVIVTVCAPDGGLANP